MEKYTMKVGTKLSVFLIILLCSFSSFSKSKIWRYGEGTYDTYDDALYLYGRPMPLEHVAKDGFDLELYLGGDGLGQFIKKESPLYEKAWFIDTLGKYDRNCVIRHGKSEGCVNMFFTLNKSHNPVDVHVHTVLKSAKK